MSMNMQQITTKIDPVLTDIARGYKSPENVGRHLFPIVPVPGRTGKTMAFNKEAFYRYNSRRAPGTDIKRISFGYEGDPYALNQDSLEVKIPKEYLEEAERVLGIDLSARGINLIMRVIERNLEEEQAEIARNSDNYDDDHKLTLAGTSKWNNTASDPYSDIDNGKACVRESIGMEPNTLLLSYNAHRAIKQNASILERIKYTGKITVTLESLKELFEVDNIIVAKSISADENTKKFQDIWGNDAILAYVAPEVERAQEVPSYGYTYQLFGCPFAENPYYENRAKSFISPVTNETKAVLTGMDAGFLFKDVV